jgi:tRNA (guanine37-N1)-methyltransferase
MRFDILTLFPEVFQTFAQTSMVGRAIASGGIEIHPHDIRDFSQNKHRKVDDIPYGGGAGMVMSCDPLFRAINFAQNLDLRPAPVIFFTPSPHRLDQMMVEDFSRGEIPQHLPQNPKKAKLPNGPFDRWILLCGHYEGIDQRVRDACVDLEISIGDFILTGGELPAQVFVDAVMRLLPGSLGKAESHEEESFSSSIGRKKIEYPHYTRPEVFEGLSVPSVLLSGHHAEIERWRQTQTIKLDEDQKSA